MTDKEIYYKTYGVEEVSKHFLNKQELHNLFKKPKKIHILMNLIFKS